MNTMRKLMLDARTAIEAVSGKSPQLTLVDKISNLDVSIETLVNWLEDEWGVILSSAEIASIETVGDLIMIFHNHITSK